MNVVYRFEHSVPYSLHDMRVSRLEMVKEHIRFYFEDGYIALGQNLQQVEGNILIENVDLDFSAVHFLSESGACGDFCGKKLGIAEFIRDYSDFSFEINDETYGYHTLVHVGWLSLPGRDKLIEMSISLYYTGNIVYEVKD